MNNVKRFFNLKESEETKAVFEQNDYDSNDVSFSVIIACAAILLIAWVLNLVGVFTVARTRMNILTIVGMIEFAVPMILYLVYKGKKRWLKYVMVFTLLLVCTELVCILNHNVILIMILPVLLSSRYFSKNFTAMVSVVSVILLAVASVVSVHFGIIDLNFYPSPDSGTVLVMGDNLRSTVTNAGIDISRAVVSMLVNGYLPRLLVFTLICAIAVYNAKNGHEMVLRQDAISRASANVKAELNTATQIQKGMVPNIFPAFPEREEFDIYAVMCTAKEVGGDFYDFFLVDEKHLAMVMADVSGKGVPAALFMMATKILISDRTLMGGKPSEILRFVNDRICSNNQAEMFVTVWLGILDLDTGRMIASNAGHEYPAIRRKGRRFELLKDKHGFVIGGMEGMNYSDYEFTLKKGDALFLYTDGIPEANNSAAEQFGSERMLDALNVNPDGTTSEILSIVRDHVNDFVGDAVQFDDYTMLCLKYNGKEPVTSEKN